MKARNKALLLVLCAVALVAVTIFGTMAYFTSKDEVRNTFTVGNVAITLDEAKVDLYGNAADNAERVKANAYKLIPGHTYTKDPTVTVLDGSEECYVRMLVTINKKAALDAIGFDMKEVFLGYDEATWIFEGQTPGDDNMVYEFRYKTAVSATDSDMKLAALFDEIQVPSTITAEQLSTLADLSIDVVAQAIQADGFADANAAWAAFE